MLPFTITLQDLPLELFQAILLIVIRVRGLKRAFRLRLVNRFFAEQVHQIFHDFRLLDDYDAPISELGDLGAEYLAQRLLNNNLPTSPAWAIIRPVAAQLAPPDEEPAKFATYVRLLCSRAVTAYGHNSMAAACLRSPVRIDESDVDSKYECVLLAAAAYLDQFSVVEKLLEDRGHQLCDSIIIGSASENAMLSGNSKALDLLQAQYKSHWAYNANVDSLTPMLSLHGSLEMFEAYRPDWTPEQLLFNERYRILFNKSLATPSVQNFNLLVRLKKKTLRPVIRKSKLTSCLHTAIREGWTAMTRQLLDMGASVEGESTSKTAYRSSYPSSRNRPRISVERDPRLSRTVVAPLTAACTHGHKDIVQMLLNEQAQVHGNEIGDAAKKGRWDIVRLLADWGVDINSGAEPPVVSALAWEREDIFFELINRGATLGNVVRAKAVERCTADGLESMLRVLDEQREISADSADKELK